MISVKDIYEVIQDHAPFEIQVDYDNAGFLVGHNLSPVTKVLVALDITEPVIEEAVSSGCQLIVSHHPVIWGSVKSVTDETPTGQKLLILMENKISAICAHTNLDAIKDGVNDELAAILGLSEITQLKLDGIDWKGRPYGIGRVGIVKKQEFLDFARSVKHILGSNGIRIMNAGNSVHTVAVGGGACADLMYEAKKLGCDTFVTSDIRYSEFLDAQSIKINLIDAGHFPTENIICPVLARWIREAFPELMVFISKSHCEVFNYL